MSPRRSRDGRRPSRDDIVWREFRDGDQHAILEMFERVFHRTMSLSYWEWRFRNCPYGPSVIRLAWHGDSLVGHYAVATSRLAIRGAEVPAVLSMTTMTDSRYLHLGIMQRLGEEAYEECRGRGIMAVYGFPNHNSFPGFIKRLGWRDMGRVYQHTTEAHRLSGGMPPGIELVEEFPEDVGSLHERRRRSFAVTTPRTREFLQWRFVDEPLNDYPILVLRANGELRGCAVLKLYDAPDGTRGHIVDMLTTEDEQAVEALLRGAAAHLLSLGAQTVSLWSVGDPSLEAALDGLGFGELDGTEAIFGCRALDVAAEAIYEPGAWHLTMADSDVF